MPRKVIQQMIFCGLKSNLATDVTFQVLAEDAVLTNRILKPLTMA
jgi:hypothetical protein